MTDFEIKAISNRSVTFYYPDIDETLTLSKLNAGYRDMSDSQLNDLATDTKNLVE